MELTCKKCNSSNFTKSGYMNDKQRFRCKDCGCNFTEGDGRTKDSTAAKKAIAIMLYTTARTSFRRIGKILGIDHSLVYRWIREVAETLPEPIVPAHITDVELDEMWHFIKAIANALENREDEPRITGDSRGFAAKPERIRNDVCYKKTNSGLSRQLTVVQGEPLHGLQVIVILKQSDDFTKSSNI